MPSVCSAVTRQISGSFLRKNARKDCVIIKEEGKDPHRPHQSHLPILHPPPLPPPTMYLYNLTLQPATNITHCVAGNFSGQKKLEIIVSRGKVLEIMLPDENTGKVQSLLSVEIFGVIRSITPFRLQGMQEKMLRDTQENFSCLERKSRAIEMK